MKEQIINEIKAELETRIEEGVEVQFRDVVKNNDVVLKGVVIKKPEENVAPTIYLDGFIEELERVVCQLVNKEKNSNRLNDAPYKEVLDLAAIYRCVVTDEENGKGSFVISNAMMKMYSIDIDELHNAALRNMKDEGFKVRSMAEVIADMMGCEPEDVEDGDMYVLNNTSQVNGATIMLYVEYFTELAEKVEDDLYILPSSIHEILAIKASFGKLEELRNMVREVNDTQVSEEERLSYNVYRYSREDRALMIA